MKKTAFFDRFTLDGFLAAPCIIGALVVGAMGNVYASSALLLVGQVCFLRLWYRFQRAKESVLALRVLVESERDARMHLILQAKSDAVTFCKEINILKEFAEAQTGEPLEVSNGNIAPYLKKYPSF
jgi:hypothetical protein